jgi:hypothetical protein
MKVGSFPNNSINNDVGKAYAVLAAQGAVCSNADRRRDYLIFCRLYRTGLRSCDRRQYSGPPL